MIRTIFGWRYGVLAAALLVTGGSSPVRAQGAEEETQFKENPSGKRGHLGVMLGERKGKVRIVEVIEGGAADKAGVKAGDRVLEVDGKAVDDASDLAEAIHARKPGEAVRLKLERDGHEVEANATLGEAPDTGCFFARRWPMEWHGALPGEAWNFVVGGPKVRLGLQLQGLTPGLRTYFKAPSDKGVLVSDVTRDSPAEKALVQAGDVLLEANGKAVATHRAVIDALEGVEPGQRVALKLLRDGAERSIDVVVDERPRSENRWFRDGYSPLTPEAQAQIERALAEARENLSQAGEQWKIEWRDKLESQHQELRERMRELKEELKEKGEKVRVLLQSV